MSPHEVFIMNEEDRAKNARSLAAGLAVVAFLTSVLFSSLISTSFL